jgi:lysozyme
MDDLKNIIVQHEGLKLLPYTDTTGNLTIGVGRNLSGQGISKEEAMILLTNDLKRCDLELTQFAWYQALDQVRKEAIIELVFNMGISRVLMFRNMIAALTDKNYKIAAAELLNSKWAEQVKSNRSNNIANRLLTGSYS